MRVLVDGKSKKVSRLTRVILTLIGFAFLTFLTLDAGYNPEHRYVGSKNSDKFHVKKCRWAKKILPKNLVSWATYKAAKADERIPCKVCKPKP